MRCDCELQMIFEVEFLTLPRSKRYESSIVKSQWSLTEQKISKLFDSIILLSTLLLLTFKNTFWPFVGLFFKPNWRFMSLLKISFSEQLQFLGRPRRNRIFPAKICMKMMNFIFRKIEGAVNNAGNSCVIEGHESQVQHHR